MVETGRFEGIHLAERICELCDREMIEDEIHFICVCSLYNELRNSLFEGILLDYPQFANLCTKDKFIYLMIYNRDR